MPKTCPGPHGDNCPKRNTTPRGGRCAYCLRVHRRSTNAKWYKDNKAHAMAHQRQKRRDYKAINPAEVLQDIAAAQAVDPEPKGLTGALRVFEIMLRAA